MDNDNTKNSTINSDLRKDCENTVESIRSDIEKLLSLSKRVEQRINELDEKEENRKSLEQKMNTNAQKAKQKIRLEVGGQIFATSKSTLLSVEGTYFHALLSSGKWEPDEDGVYFIDRDPLHFDRILNYLRTGEFIWKGLDDFGKEKLEKDLDYYQIPIDTSSPIKWDKNRCGVNIVLSNDDMTATKKSGSHGWNGAIIATQPEVRYSVKINRFVSGNIMVGMVSSEQFNSNGPNYNRYGYYIYTCNGSYYSMGLNNSIANAPIIREGSIVTVVHDTTTSQINFIIDGRDCGVAFRNVIGKLYPAIDIHDGDASVTIV